MGELKAMSTAELDALMAKRKGKAGKGKVELAEGDNRVLPSGNLVVTYDETAMIATLTVSLDPERVAVLFDDVKDNLWYARGAGHSVSKEEVLPHGVRIGLNVYKKVV